MTMNSETKRRMLTVKEAAKLIDGITAYRIRVMCKSGELRSFKAGSKYLISEYDLYETILGKDFVNAKVDVETPQINKEPVKAHRHHNLSTVGVSLRKEPLNRSTRLKRK